MGDMGCGYGSKWQLHNFLTGRKEVLNNAIKEQTAIKGAIKWLGHKNDAEYIGIGFPCLQDRSDFASIESKWKQFWPQRAMSWDGIFTCDGEIVMVEAKAHTNELSESGTRSGKSGSDEG